MDVERHRLCDRLRPRAGAEVGGLGRDCIIPPAIKAPHDPSHFPSSSSHHTSPCFSSSFLLPFHCFSLLFAFAFLFFCIYIFIFLSIWSFIRGTQHRAVPLVIAVEIPLTHRQHQPTDDHQGGHVPNAETCNSCFSSLLGRGHLGHADHGWLNTYQPFPLPATSTPKGFGALRVLNEDRGPGPRQLSDHCREHSQAWGICLGTSATPAQEASPINSTQTTVTTTLLPPTPYHHPLIVVATLPLIHSFAPDISCLASNHEYVSHSSTPWLRQLTHLVAPVAADRRNRWST